MKTLLAALLLMISMTVSALPSVVNQAVCDPPTTYTNNEPIVGALTYKLYCKTDKAVPYKASDLRDTQTSCSFTLSVLVEPGTYWCTVSAVDSQGAESENSEDVNFTLSNGIFSLIGPNSPTGFRLQ